MLHLPPEPMTRARVAAAALLLTLGLSSADLLTASVQPVAGPHAERLLRDPDGTPLPFKDSGEILHFLATAEIVHSERLGRGTTNPLRVTLQANGVRSRAVFRDVELSRDRVELRDGSEYVQFFDRAIHEVAAYELAIALGIEDLVPPVVERWVEGVAGTLQIWVENSVTEGERAEERMVPPNHTAWRHQQADMLVFDTLIANADRNSGNSLIDADWNLWLIDHTRGFQRPRGSLELIGVDRVSAHLLRALRDLDHDALRGRLDRYLERPQIGSMLDRHGKLLEHFDRLIAERGEGAVVIG